MANINQLNLGDVQDWGLPIDLSFDETSNIAVKSQGVVHAFQHVKCSLPGISGERLLSLLLVLQDEDCPLWHGGTGDYPRGIKVAMIYQTIAWLILSRHAQVTEGGAVKKKPGDYTEPLTDVATFCAAKWYETNGNEILRQVVETNKELQTVVVFPTDYQRPDTILNPC